MAAARAADPEEISAAGADLAASTEVAGSAAVRAASGRAVTSRSVTVASALRRAIFPATDRSPAAIAPPAALAVFHPPLARRSPIPARPPMRAAWRFISTLDVWAC